MRFAIEGFLEEQVLDLGSLGHREIELLKQTPGSALGSCRYKLRDEDLPEIQRLLEKYNVRYLFYIGGNDTMDTIHRISRYCSDHGYEVRGVGIPKTVDNDLFATDHTPGYPSAARYVAQSVAQTSRLARDMQRVDRFLVHQTIGRDAGWLAAAAALARRSPEDGPHLIYVPEMPIEQDSVLSDVQRAIDRYGWASIVIGEGTTWSDGTPVSAAAATDRFDNVEFGAMGGSSAALNLHRLIATETGYRGEFQIPESMPMSASDRRGPHDMQEAYACGVEALHRALRDEGGVMITIERSSGPREAYAVSYGTAALQEVAVHARPMPPEMLTPGFVTDTFLEYLRPLVGELESYLDISDRYVTK
jgi:6-phosphofructokinase 1